MSRHTESEIADQDGRKRRRWWPAAGRGALWASLALLGACGPGGEPESGALFRDRTRELGLPVDPGPVPDGTYHLPELMHGGVGLFDYDGDGDLDLLHVRTPFPGGEGRSISNRLYRQEADGRFVDVTEEARLSRPGFGQGMAIGDVDNDGDPDLYIANYGHDAFYRNNGDGSFEWATEEAGFAGDPQGRWSSAASFFDYDGDGWLDLYVVHYVRFSRERRCADPRDRTEYCGPNAYPGMRDTLYHNNGDGSFRDVTKAAGVVLPDHGARATGLGIACTDFTGDGLPDVFVANDAQSNQLWVNQGDGSFREEALLRGVAADQFGHPEASMGVATGDANGDGVLDLFVTHLWHENNRLFLGGKASLFRDGTPRARMGSFDHDRTGWGCGFFDFDHDGDMDLAMVNGGIRRRSPLPGAPEGMWSEYAEPNQLFENDGTGVFTQNDKKAGPFSSPVEVSRGLAFGDLDRDGDLDMVVSNIANRIQVLSNEAPAAGTHWLEVRATTHGRDALGAQVRVRAGEHTFCAAILAAGSYLSSNEAIAHFGLGARDHVEAIEVIWSDGRLERFPGGPADRVRILRRGEGSET